MIFYIQKYFRKCFHFQELTALLRAMGQNPTDSEVNDMINEVDVEGSGVVEFEVKFFIRVSLNLILNLR